MISCPYEQSEWAPQEAAQRRRWCEILDEVGPENVRAILAQNTAGSRARLAGPREIETGKHVSSGSNFLDAMGSPCGKCGGYRGGSRLGLQHPSEIAVSWSHVGAETFEPVTLAHIRRLGCRDLLVAQSIAAMAPSSTATRFSDETPIRPLGARMVCT
jgi:hypothetical protein